MPSLSLSFVANVTIGGALRRFERESVVTVGDICYDNQFNLLDGAVSESQFTIFDSSVHTNAANFSYGIIIVDPDDDYEDGDAEAHVHDAEAGTGLPRLLAALVLAIAAEGLSFFVPDAPWSRPAGLAIAAAAIASARFDDQDRVRVAIWAARARCFMVGSVFLCCWRQNTQTWI